MFDMYSFTNINFMRKLETKLKKKFKLNKLHLSWYGMLYDVPQQRAQSGGKK